MSIDTIGNFLTIIRNGVRASKPFVVAPHSKLNVEIAKILKQEGFIRNFEVSSEGVKSSIKISLKYVDNESVIHEIARVSSPGRRVYSKINEIKPVVGGFGITILSTNRGLMTDKQAKEPSLKIGGEVLCRVW